MNLSYIYFKRGSIVPTSNLNTFKMGKLIFDLDFLKQLSEVNLTPEAIIYVIALSIIYYLNEYVMSIINKKGFFCKKDKNGFIWGVKPPKN